MLGKKMLAFIAVVLLFIGGLGFLDSLDTIRNKNALDNEAVTAKGKIYSKNETKYYSKTSDGRDYFLYVSYEFEGGEYSNQFTTTRSLYADAKIGDEVEVRFQRSNPWNSEMYWEEDAEPKSNFWTKVFGGIFLSLFCLGLIITSNALQSR